MRNKILNLVKTEREEVLLFGKWIQLLKKAVSRRDKRSIGRFQRRAERVLKRVYRFQEELLKVVGDEHQRLDTQNLLHKVSIYVRRMEEEFANPLIGERGTIPILLKETPTDWEKVEEEIENLYSKDIAPLSLLVKEIEKDFRNHSNQLIKHEVVEDSETITIQIGKRRAKVRVKYEVAFDLFSPYTMFEPKVYGFGIFYKFYLQFLQENKLTKLQEEPNTLQRNFIRFISKLVKIHILLDFWELFSLIFERKFSAELSHIPANERKQKVREAMEIYLREIGLLKINVVKRGEGQASAKVESSSGVLGIEPLGEKIFGTINIDPQETLPFYLKYKTSGKYQTQYFSKVFSHEVAHLFDSELILLGDSAWRRKDYTQYLLHRIRAEGLASIIQYRNSQSSQFDPSYWHDLYRDFQDIPTMIANGKKPREIYDRIGATRSIYVVGHFLCLIYLISSSKSFLIYGSINWSKEERNKIIVFENKAYLSKNKQNVPFIQESKFWLEEYFRQTGEFLIVNYPKEIYTHYYELQSMDLKEFVEKTAKAAKSLGVSSEFNFLTEFI